MVESAPALALVFVQDKSVADDGRALGERGEEDTQVDNSFLKKGEEEKKSVITYFWLSSTKISQLLGGKM